MRSLYEKCSFLLTIFVQCLMLCRKSTILKIIVILRLLGTSYRMKFELFKKWLRRLKTHAYNIFHTRLIMLRNCMAFVHLLKSFFLAFLESFWHTSPLPAKVWNWHYVGISTFLKWKGNIHTGYCVFNHIEITLQNRIEIT